MYDEDKIGKYKSTKVVVCEGGTLQNQGKPALAWFINQNRNTIPIPVYAKGTRILTLVCIPKPE